jgi:hypothetical protein
VRVAAFGDELDGSATEVLDALGFTEDGKLTAACTAFEEAAWVYDDQATAARLFRDALLGLPATQALLQGLHGRGPVSFAGAHHFMARHDLAERGDQSKLRAFLVVLNVAGIVAYSNKLQTVRALAPVPEELAATLRVVEPERPYSNVLALRETLRACDDYIWWAEVHLDRKALESLSYEADGARIAEIRLLSGSANANEDTKKDLKRFTTEMKHLGITVEWRIVPKKDLDWHDRFILGRNQAWNVPPVNTLHKGDYSELSRTRRPPFEAWWKKGVPVADWLNQQNQTTS